MSGNAVTRRLRRLFSMSGDEFATRSRQELAKRIDGVLAKAGHDFPEAPRTSRSTTPAFFFNSEDVPAILSVMQQRLPGDYNQILLRAERICQHRFDLLGYRDLEYGKEIDWSLDRVHGKRAPSRLFYRIRYLDFDECGDVKVTWELNRHQHLLTLAKAYRITGDPRFANEIFEQWEHWHRQNPYPYGVNWASSLEFAFRSLSWLWTYRVLGNAAEQRPRFREQFLRSLSVHARAIERYISTYFSPNTHLLGEAVALFFIGVLCPELPSAERWKDLGWKVTLQEARQQVRPDGLHFEQSLYYHVYAVDFFLHARILASRNGIEVPADYDAKIQRMLNALAVLGRTGNVPRIGDDDGGRLFDGQRNRTEHLLDPLAAGAVLYERGDFKVLSRGLREETLWLLGSEAARRFDNIPEQQPEKRSTAFAASGLYVINDTDRQIVVDAGPLGTGNGGHGHADALSICVSDGDGPVLIDSGTYEYVGDGAERNQFRGTSAHNTVAIDGSSQPEPRGPFAWSHHPRSAAERWITGEHFDLLTAATEGCSGLTHRRTVFCRKSSFWFVRDVLQGTGEHKIDAYWHLAPEFTFAGRGRFTRSTGGVLDLIALEGGGWSQEIETGSWSPAYGEAQPAPILHFSTVASLPGESVTLFRSRESGSLRAGSLTLPAESPQARGYVYLENTEEHRFFFGRENTSWTLSGWSSDAEFLYWGYDRREDKALLIFCNATKLSFAGQEIAASPNRPSYCEILWENGRAKVLAPDGGDVIIHDSGLRNLTAEPTLTVARQLNG